MLAKLSVILGVFVAIVLGQARDCKVVPRMQGFCCMNMIEDSAEEERTRCKDEIKFGNFSCAMSTCIMEKKNLFGSDNKINAAAFTKYIKHHLKEFSPSVATTLEKCIAETETSECVPDAFLECLYSALERDCPSAFWLKTEECTTLKKFYVDCPNSTFLLK